MTALRTVCVKVCICSEMSKRCAANAKRWCRTYNRNNDPKDDDDNDDGPLQKRKKVKVSAGAVLQDFNRSREVRKNQDDEQGTSSTGKQAKPSKQTKQTSSSDRNDEGPPRTRIGSVSRQTLMEGAGHCDSTGSSTGYSTGYWPRVGFGPSKKRG